MMLILEPNGQLDRQLPRRRSWRARLMAWLFGAKRKSSELPVLGTLIWEVSGLQGEDTPVSGRI